MSGGVDSSVTAAILKEQGFEVIGLFMKNWEELDDSGVCQSAKDYEDVIKVCEKIDIPYYSVEFINQYRDDVFAHFLQELKIGRTPNPDILCNREIKFKVFFEEVKKLGADFLATGHYCQTIETPYGKGLAKGFDTNKDQSYFLHAINGSVLEQVLFPIGNLPKPVVREIAAKYDLATKNKKDSTGICFIGERNFGKFLGQFIQYQTGLMKTLSGEVLGEHTGVAFYTLGQRKGLGLGGQGEPWFVVGKDLAKNELYVERGEFHPALYSRGLIASNVTLIHNEVELTGRPLKAKIRYRQADQDCLVERLPNNEILVRFSEPQRAVTPGQSVVFYDGEICLGGAVIDAPVENLFTHPHSHNQILLQDQAF
jgi:tRNA-specific 2-thiouridylase